MIPIPFTVLWLIALIVFAVGEAITVGLTSVWFCGGCAGCADRGRFWRGAVAPGGGLSGSVRGDPAAGPPLGKEVPDAPATRPPTRTGSSAPQHWSQRRSTT